MITVIRDFKKKVQLWFTSNTSMETLDRIGMVLTLGRLHAYLFPNIGQKIRSMYVE